MEGSSTAVREGLRPGRDGVAGR